MTEVSKSWEQITIFFYMEMKRIIKTALLSVAALAAVSCQKDRPGHYKPLTITAISEDVGVGSKAEMSYRYAVLWNNGDKIFVTDGGNSDSFTLSAGAGTPTGTFTQDGGTRLSGNVEAFYPKDTGSSRRWPETQSNNQVVPMYCRKTISGTGGQTFNFSSLGAVLQLVFNTLDAGVTLKSIKISDATKSMSGPFTVDDSGKAVIQTSGTPQGITLDLGSGTALGQSAKYFNISLPAGEYKNVTLVFTATDGRKCTMTSSTFPVIEKNAVYRITLAGKHFTKQLPSGALPGIFSVGAGPDGQPGTADDIKVHFAKGNLRYNSSTKKFDLEENQYDFPVAWDVNHIGHFFWSKDSAVAVKNPYSDSAKGDNDVLFTNKDANTPNPDFTVAEVKGSYRTLSKDEWEYLFNDRPGAGGKFKPIVIVNGKNCLVIAPDEWSGEIQYTYDDYSSWAAAEKEGLVCIPFAGTREESMINNYEIVGECWASSADGFDTAIGIKFDWNSPSIAEQESRSQGCSIRLVVND